MPRTARPSRPRPIRTLAQAGVIGLAGLSLVAMPGCLASGHSSVRAEGRYIGPDTINKIEPGVTTREWVAAVLGEPTTRTTLTDGSEIWKWSSKKVTRSSGSLFLVFRGSERDVIERTVYVELDGDLVSRVWKD